MPKIHIIYASTSGNTEVVVEKIALELGKSRIDAELHRASGFNYDVIKENDTFIFATSTWEHGVINPYFDKTLEKMKEDDFSGKSAAFVGLGDTRYEQVLFCEGANILQRTFTGNKGIQLTTILKINGNPYDVLDTMVVDWVEKFIKEIGDKN